MQISELRQHEVQRARDWAEEGGLSLEGNRLWPSLSLAARSAEQGLTALALTTDDGRRYHVQLLLEPSLDEAESQHLRDLLLGRTLRKLVGRGVHACHIRVHQTEPCHGFWRQVNWLDQLAETG